MISADHMQLLISLKLTPEQFQGVLTILAELRGADDARRERERVRRSKYARKDGPRDGPKDKTVTVTVTEVGPSQDAPLSDSLKKERKIQETDKESVSCDGGPTRAELEKELFRRGRQVLGKASGGLIAQLLKAKQQDVSLTRATIETAATKHDAREYVAGAIRNANGRQNDPKSLIAALDRQIEHFGGVEAASSYVPGSSGPTPLRLDFGQVQTSHKRISQG